MDLQCQLLVNGVQKSNFRVKHAIAIILRNLKHDEMNVNALALSLHISPSHLRRIILSATEKTPNQLIKHYRLERARELLAGVLSIKEISHSVGIKDVSHFVRDFKVKYGMRPSEYRGKPDGHPPSGTQYSARHYAMQTREPASGQARH